MRFTGIRHVLRKDRFPYPGTGITDGREKLAVLVDASNVSHDLYPAIETIVDRSGAVCLRRYFEHKPSYGWKNLEGTHGFEKFRVDSFVPIHIQMIADATHIAEYRELNMLTGVALVVNSSQGDAFAEYHKRLAWHDVKFFIFTENGLHFELSQDTVEQKK